MNVAYLCLDPGIPIFATKGASSHVREFVCALHGLSHTVTVFAAAIGDVRNHFPARIVEVPIQTAFAEGLPKPFRKEVKSLWRNRDLCRLLRESHGPEPFDFVYERYSLWSYAGIEAAKSLDIPFALEVNSPLRLEQQRYRELHLEPAAGAVEQLLFRCADLVVGVSDAVIAYVRETSQRSLPSLVLPNGVDLSLFRKYSPPQPGRGKFTIGFVGSLKPWHGLEVLLDAFERVRQVSSSFELLIVGEGPMQRWVEERIARSRLESSVRLTGGVEKACIPALLGQMDVAVAPYPKLDEFYFSPLKIFEYMASGRAIVASRIGQVTTVLRDRETALLADPGDAEQLADRILELYRSPALATRLGNAARAESFNLHGWTSRVADVLKALNPVSDRVQQRQVA